ncbi:MAG: hypothetical protein WB697_07760 [Stellaceae bacterium]
MITLPNDLLNRLRALPQALADLIAKHDEPHFKHPKRHDLARIDRAAQSRDCLAQRASDRWLNNCGQLRLGLVLPRGSAIRLFPSIRNWGG